MNVMLSFIWYLIKFDQIVLCTVSESFLMISVHPSVDTKLFSSSYYSSDEYNRPYGQYGIMRSSLTFDGILIVMGSGSDCLKTFQCVTYFRCFIGRESVILVQKERVGYT